MGQEIRWSRVLGDSAIIFGASFSSGFLLARMGVAFAPILTIAYILATAGFCISGCLAREQRFQHLFVVAVSLWLLNSVSIATGSLAPSNWAAGLLGILAQMGVGGFLSLLFVKPQGTEPFVGAPWVMKRLGVQFLVVFGSLVVWLAVSMAIRSAAGWDESITAGQITGLAVFYVLLAASVPQIWLASGNSRRQVAAWLVAALSGIIAREISSSGALYTLAPI